MRKTRDKKLTVRFSEAERDELGRIAKTKGESISDMVRAAIVVEGPQYKRPDINVSGISVFLDLRISRNEQLNIQDLARKYDLPVGEWVRNRVRHDILLDFLTNAEE